MSSRRINIDYGPAVLPFGELAIQDSAPSVGKQIERDALRLQRMLFHSTSPQSACDRVSFSCDANQAERIEGMSAFNEAALGGEIEQLCCKANSGGPPEAKVKVAPCILPDTWILVRKIGSGLLVELQSTSSSTTLWLQSVAEKLADSLQRRLQCPVSVIVSTEQDAENCHIGNEKFKRSKPS